MNPPPPNDSPEPHQASTPLPPIINDIPPIAPPGPWGSWATIGWSVLILGAFIFAQTITALVYHFSTHGFNLKGGVHMETIMMEGNALSAIALSSAPVMVFLCWAIARLRPGFPVKDYLGLRWPSLKTSLKWLGAFVLFVTIVDIALSVIEGGASEEFMRNTIQSVGPYLPILIVALAVAAPVSEEIFFRGFLFTGLERSRLGGWGTVLITALLFASIHLQYDLQGLLFIFAIGLFFGVVRLKTGSVPLCMVLHSVLNLISTLWFIFFDTGPETGPMP